MFHCGNDLWTGRVPDDETGHVVVMIPGMTVTIRPREGLMFCPINFWLVDLSFV